VLGWNFPAHIFDQHTAYLAVSNILLPYNPDEVHQKPRKRLPDACRHYGIEGWEHIDKEDISKAIGDGTWREHYSQQDVTNYCEEDVRKSVKLLRAQLLTGADVPRILHWSNYSAKAIALIQARGMPIDMPLWNLVQENKATVVGELLRQFDPSYGSEEPIYTEEGEWSYRRFEQHLVRIGVTAWPRLESGQLDTDSDAFRMMYHVPGIEGLHALRDSLGFIVKARLPIGKDGRNRPSLFPFGTVTGRNAHAKSPYNAHAGMRGFMMCPPGSIMFYLDWRSQEVGVAAALSGDQTLIDDYASGDVYHALARLCGLTDDPDPVRWKKEHRDQRGPHEAAATRDQLRHGRAVLGTRPGSSSTDRQRDYRTAQAPPSSLLAVAQRYGAGRPPAAPHGQRVRLAAAYQPQRQSTHAVQFSNAIGRRRNAAVGRHAVVRRRYCADHADS
jgi:hypothetical protein